MGFYDREYYRGDESGFRIGDVALVTQIVFVTVGIFLANVLFSGDDNAITEFLALRAGDLARPQFWWRLLSYGFVHSPENARHIAINMFVLWMFGREVEGVYGRAEFLRFYLVSIVVGGLFWAAHNYFVLDNSQQHLIGASGGVTAAFMLFVCNFPKRTILLFFVLPVPAWLLGVLYVLMDILGARGAVGNVAYDVHLVGAAFALLYWYSGRRLYWLAPTSWWRGGKPFRRRARLRVHKPQPSVDDEDYHELDEKADAVLDKVARDGIESLTAKERRVLEAYSRRMQQKHR